MPNSSQKILHLPSIVTRPPLFPQGPPTPCGQRPGWWSVRFPAGSLTHELVFGPGWRIRQQHYHERVSLSYDDNRSAAHCTHQHEEHSMHASRHRAVCHFCGDGGCVCESVKLRFFGGFYGRNMEVKTWKDVPMLIYGLYGSSSSISKMHSCNLAILCT